jgi:hypothetical protein
MRQNKSGKLALIVIVASVVAALTTVAVFFLRARAKRRAMCAGTAFDYDLDDCDCYDDECSCDCCGDAEEPEEAVQPEKKENE